MALQDNLIASWNMNDDWLDAKNSHDGTADGATFTSSSKLGSHAGLFDGIDDHVQIADSDDFSFGDGATDSPFSVSGWIYMVDATGFSILSKDNSGQREWFFEVSSTDQLRVVLIDNSAGKWIGRIDDSPITGLQGAYHHVAFTYSGSSTSAGIKLYIDSNRVDDTNVDFLPYTAMENTAEPVSIGGDRFGNFADGRIDALKVFNIELTQDNIDTLYNVGVGIELPVVAAGSGLLTLGVG